MDKKTIAICILSVSLGISIIFSAFSLKKVEKEATKKKVEYVTVEVYRDPVIKSYAIPSPPVPPAP